MTCVLVRSMRITLAPMSPSIMEHIGPGPMPASSTIVSPESGPPAPVPMTFLLRNSVPADQCSAMCCAKKPCTRWIASACAAGSSPVIGTTPSRVV